MALYHYQAFSREGKRVTGTLDATSVKHAQDQLAAQGLFPVNIEAIVPGTSRFSLSSLFEKSVGLKEKIFFTKQLSVLLKAGVPLVDALSLLAEQTEGQLRNVVISLRDTIKEGKSLADGMAQFPKIFETIYIQLVKAGEASGRLEVILDRLTSYQERRDEVRKKIRSALTYPLIQLAIISIVVVVLVTFVVPQIAGMFAQMSAQLPLITRILQNTSDFMRQYYLIIIGVLAALYIAYRTWKATPQGARTIDTIKLHLPVVKYFARMSAVVQFSSTLGMLVEGGVNLAESLDIVCNIIDNRVLVDELRQAREQIIKQGHIAEYLKRTGIFPPMAIYLINTGEQSGQLAQMLDAVARNYEVELMELSDSLTAKLNPIMLLVMATVVGFIVLAIMLPLADLGNTLKGM